MLLKIFLYFCLCGAWAQRPSFSNDLDTLFSVSRIGTFDDSSPCPCGSLCANNATASECPSGRVVERPECECCFSCAKQAGEPCDNVNNLCDSDRGLHCSPRRICEPKEPCRNDRDCSSDKLCFGGACANPCKLFNPCARSLPSGVCTTRDHRPVCSCAKGSENRGGVCVRTAPEEKQCFHDGKIYEIGSSFTTRNCTEKCVCRPDGSFLCEPVNCPRGFFRQGLNQDNLCFEKVEADAPDCCVRIVCESPSALEEEIVYYDEEPNGEFPAQNNGFNATSLDESIDDAVNFPNSQEAEGPIHLMATERSLSSIALVWDDQVPDGRSYVIEYRPRGSQIWQTSPVSSGNSLVLSNLRPSTEYEIRLAVMDSLARKTVPSSDDIAVRTEEGCFDNGTVYPAGTSFTKGCESNCTCDASGNLSCSPRCSGPFFRAGTFADDEFCAEWPSSDSCCVTVACSNSAGEEVIMKAGDDKVNDSCLFKNQTYSRGEKFFDGCEYSCECDQKPEIVCKPRCTPVPDIREPGCDVVPDPVDECCSIIACNKDQVTLTTTTKSSITSDGCTFKGASYRRDETFFDGCEQRCQCLGFGDIECTTRCPPLGHGSGDCTVKQDPNDPCCSIFDCTGSKTEDTTVAEVAPTTVPVTTTTPPKTTLTVVKFDVGDAKTVKLEFPTTISTTLSPPTSSPKKSPKIEKVDLIDSQRIAVRFAVDTDQLANIRAVPGYVRVLRSVDLEKWESEDINPFDVVHDVDKPKQAGVEIPISRGEQEVFLRLELGGNSSNTIAVETKATGIPREGTGCLADRVIPVGSNYTDDCGQHCHCADNGRAICDYSCEPEQKSDCPSVQRCNQYEERRVRKSSQTDDEVIGNSKFTDFEDENQFEGGRFPLIDKLLKQMGKDKENDAETREEPSVDALDEVINESPAQDLREPAEPGFCSYKGKQHKAGEEFYDGCASLCSCNEDSSVDCAAIECPSDFGLDLINPNCLEWEHHNTSREPPNCCSEPKCLNDGSCLYNGEKFRNFDELPVSATGCDKRCFCEFGNVTCSARCPPVVAVPPRNLPCDPSQITLDHLPNDKCCKYWQCRPPGEKIEEPLPTEIETPFGSQNIQQNAKEITNLTATALNFSTVEVEFNVPTLYVGLHGYSEVLYRLLGFGGEFESKEFREPDGTFGQVHQRHLLLNLREDAIYELKVRAQLELGGNSEPIESELVRVETPFNPADFEDFPSPAVSSTTSAPAPAPSVSHHPSKMVVDAELKAVDLKPNEATIQWRNFEQNERQLIDGIQLRYKNLDVNAQVFTMTNLLHRDVTSYKLEELMPSTMYEVDIIFMPFENQVTELISDKPIRFKTFNIEDPYNFNVSLSTTRVSEMSTDLNWTGVPYPEDKYVSIYRVLFQGDGDPDTAAAFKLAKHDAPSSMTVKELKPGHRYRFWIEAYLTNGKVKTSNVIDVITKPGPIPKLALAGAGPVHSSQLREGEGSDQGYFLAVVILAIVAGCALLMVLILSVVLARRGTKATATITARKSQSAYDNPSYKNYEAGDANGHRNKNLNDAL